MKNLTSLEIAALKYIETKQGRRPQKRVLKNALKKAALQKARGES